MSWNKWIQVQAYLLGNPNQQTRSKRRQEWFVDQAVSTKQGNRTPELRKLSQSQNPEILHKDKIFRKVWEKAKPH